MVSFSTLKCSCWLHLWHQCCQHSCSVCVLGWLHLSPASHPVDYFLLFTAWMLPALYIPGNWQWSTHCSACLLVFPRPYWLLSDLFDSFFTSGWFLIAGVLKSLSLGSSFLLYLYFIPRWPYPFHRLKYPCITLYLYPWCLPWVPYLYITLPAWHFHGAVY